MEAEFGKTVLTIFGKLQENSYFDCLQMFTMGVLLTMSEMSRYKQAALKLLKNIVSKSQQLQTLRKNSSWLVRYRFSLVRSQSYRGIERANHKLGSKFEIGLKRSW